MSKLSFLIMSFLLIISIAVVGTYWLLKSPSYSLTLPDPADVKSITIDGETITAGETVLKLIETLEGGQRRVTRLESISDEPQNAGEHVQIDFHFWAGGASRVYVYRRGGRCWLEQPYNGIYRISEEEYRAVTGAAFVENGKTFYL